MTSRRSFFKRVAAFVAVVAIAPEIAFRKRIDLPKLETQYSCIIMEPTKEFVLKSATWPTLIDVRIIENFSA